jgi:hypothetical protein
VNDEREKKCTRCGEYWPADEEFFRMLHRYGSHSLASWCRACETEQKAEHRRQQAQEALA